MTAGSAAEAAAQEKHKQDANRENRGWVWIPVVETFGAWCEAGRRQGDVEGRRGGGPTAGRTNVSKSVMIGALFGHPPIALQRANARAIQRRYESLRAQHWVWGWKLAGVTLAAALVANCHGG